ncbi:MAG: DUF6318 family protein [Actinomycetota bacterium]
MAVAAVGLVLLAGCSRPVERPAPLPTPTAPAVSGTPSPSPLLPTPSPTVTEYSPAGATAFVEYYFAVLNFSIATGQTDELSTLSTPSCRTCRGYIEAIRMNWSAGRVEGGTVTLIGPQTPAFRPGDEVSVSGSYRVEASRTLAPDGRVLREEPADRGGRVHVTLQRSAERWQVSAIRIGGQT